MSEEEEVYRRPRLDDNEEETNNDDESEEEIGSNRDSSIMHDDEEEEEEEDNEATDAELLREIENEKRRKEEIDKKIELFRMELINNGSLLENDTFIINKYENYTRYQQIFGNFENPDSYEMPGNNLENDPNAQLTTFQENIITTGSGASVVLLIILAIMFVVQFLRKVYEHYKKVRIENSIDSVLGEAAGERVEDFTMRPTAYAVYNTPFDERDLYEQKEREGADLHTLQTLLEKRAIRVILRGTKIQEDSAGIKKNWQLDMVPKDVWDDFCAAQANVQREFESIIKENEQKQFNWGPKHQNNILMYAKEKIQFERHKQMENFKRMRAANPQMQNNPNMQRPTPRASSLLNGPNSTNSGNNAPSARNFGKGLKQGFLNQKPPPKEKLTRRQKKKLKQQQQQQAGEQGQGPPGSGDANVYNATPNDFQPQTGTQTNPQRRKRGKRRMAR